MRSILKGSLPVALICSLFLAIATGALVPGESSLRVGLSGGPYPLASWLSDALVDRRACGLPASGWVLLAIFGITGGLLFRLFFRWTGNRIASLVGALLGILHPVHVVHWRDPDQLASLLPLPLILLALVAHLEIKSQQGILKWVAVLSASAAALASGSMGVALGSLMLLLYAFDSPIEDSERRERKFEIGSVVLISLLATWALGRFSGAHSSDGLFPSLFSRLIAYPANVPQSLLVGGAIFVSCSLAFLAGMMRLRAPRRWLIHFASLASGWLLLVVLQHQLGWIESSAAAVTLGVLPFCIVPPVLVWRLLLTVLSMDGPPAFAVSVPSVVPPLDRAALADARWPARDGPLLPHADLLALRHVLNEVRQALPSQGPSAVPLVSQTTESYDEAYRSAVSKAEGSAVLKRRQHNQLRGPWSDPSLAEDLFEYDCRPHLRPSGRVLLLGTCIPWLTQRFLDAGQSLVKVAEEPLQLLNEQILQFEGERVSSLLSDDANLRALASGTVDFAIACEHLLFASHDEILDAMTELHRVLRPGSCAVLLLGNLKDPAGLEHLRAQSSPSGESLRARRRQFTTPEAVQVLAEVASLSVDTIRLAANNSDMFVVLKREVS